MHHAVQTTAKPGATMSDNDPLTAALQRAVRDAVREALADAAEPGALSPDSEPVGSVPDTWRARLWSCHPETRLNVDELAEAVGRPKSTIYKWTAGGEVPHRKDLSGGLVFVAGQVRAWIRDSETPVIEGRSYTPGVDRPRLKVS